MTMDDVKMVLEPTVEELEELWDNHWTKRKERDPHRKADSFRYSSSVELLPAAGGELLDVSGGDGTFAYLARERHPGYAITVIDRSRAAVGICAERGFRSLQADLDKGGLPFEDDSFDVVTCLSVLQDLTNPWQLLAELTRVSRRWVLVSCPSAASASNRLDLLFGKVPRQMRHKTHLRFVTYEEVTRRLEGHGFRIADRRTKMKLPVLRSVVRIPGLKKPALMHKALPNLASKFTILAEKSPAGTKVNQT